jgi:hypothetical protein
MLNKKCKLLPELMKDFKLLSININNANNVDKCKYKIELYDNKIYLTNIKLLENF